MEEEIKKKPLNQKKKNIIILILAILVIGIIISIFIFQILQKRNEEKIAFENELNSKLELSYNYIYKDYNCDEFENILNSFEEEEYKLKVYDKLDKALYDLIINISANYNVSDYYKLYDLFSNLEKNFKNNETVLNIIKDKKHLYYYYSYIHTGETNENSQNFIGAYVAYTSASKEINCLKEENERKENIKQKVESIQGKAYESLKTELNTKISSKDYSGNYEGTYYENIVKYSNDEDLKNTYQKYLNVLSEHKTTEEKEKRKQQGVYLGMTKQQVLDSSWGEPQKINTSIGSWGTHEQWVYGNGNYLYFENGKLTSIQN